MGAELFHQHIEKLRAIASVLFSAFCVSSPNTNTWMTNQPHCGLSFPTTDNNPEQMQQSPGKLMISHPKQLEHFSSIFGEEIEKLHQIFEQLSHQNLKLQAHCEQKRAQIAQLEECLREISTEFSHAKLKMQLELEAVRKCADEPQHSILACHSQLREKDRTVVHLNNEIATLTEEKLIMVQNLQRDKNCIDHLIDRNCSLELENLELRGKMQLIGKDSSKTLASSIVINNNIKKEGEKEQGNFHKPTAFEQKKSAAMGSSKSNRSFLIDNPLSQRLVFSRIRSRSFRNLKNRSERKDEGKPGLPAPAGLLSIFARSDTRK